MDMRPLFAAMFMFASDCDVTDAAVRHCGPVVASEIVTAPNELDAKKKALAQWRIKALQHGTAFDSWRLAADKSLKCFPKDQGFECIAFGAPCVVDQNPGELHGVPGRKGIGI